jgi:hypothetical protein
MWIKSAIAGLVALGCQATPYPRVDLTTAKDNRPHLREASGVARDGDSLLFVGDEAPGTYYAYALQPSDRPANAGDVLSKFVVDSSNLVAHSLFSSGVLDLEGIALLGPGRPVAVSERLRALVSPEGLVAEYPGAMTEIGNRGLEGVAVRLIGGDSARIAVLWEGGFPERRVPMQVDALPGFLTTAFRPVICVHTMSMRVRSTDLLQPCRNASELIQLDVPTPPDTTQRFRAPDLVWLPDAKGFLVLLSSQNATSSASVTYRYKWLQKFDAAGRRMGDGFNLCGVLPDPVRTGRTGNVEGLGWYEDGKSVVLVNDFAGPATVVILSIDPWPPAATATAC